MEYENIKLAVGKRFKEVREQRNLSQMQVETLSGIDRSYLSKLEQGKVNPTLETMIRLSEVYKCQVHVLLCYLPE